MSDDKTRIEMIQTIGIGMDAEVFLNSKLGEAIMARAQEEAIDSMNELKVIKRSAFPDSDAYEARILELQSVIARAESLEGWILDIVTDGKNTETLMLSAESEEDESNE